RRPGGCTPRAPRSTGDILSHFRAAAGEAGEARAHGPGKRALVGTAVAGRRRALVLVSLPGSESHPQGERSARLHRARSISAPALASAGHGGAASGGARAAGRPPSPVPG